MTNSKEKRNKIDFLGKYLPKSLYNEKIKKKIKDLTPDQQEQFIKSLLEEKKEQKSENPLKKIFNFIFKK